MNKHRLVLLGDFHGELRVPATLLHETVGALIEGARQATRFALEGESVRKGPRPAWLDTVCRIDVTALAPGSAVLTLEAPTLEEADPARFGSAVQGTLFEDAGVSVAKRTCVELFASVLADIVEGDTESLMADRALLDTCARFAGIAEHMVHGVRLEGLRGRAPVTVTPEHVHRIEVLRDETPAPQAVRVCGTLDTISASRPDVILKLPDDTRVSARLESHEPSVLEHLFGKDVVVSGVAHYRPSGKLLRVDVESLSEARDADQLFARVPVGRAGLPVAAVAAQDESSGVAAFFGTWPGDESEDDLLEALRAIR